MSVQSEIDRISANIAGAYSAVADMGGTLPEKQVSGNLAEAVRSIPAGREERQWRLIRDIVLDEDTRNIVLDSDDSGKGFELSELYIYTNATNVNPESGYFFPKLNEENTSFVGTTSAMGVLFGAAGAVGRNWVWVQAMNPLIILHGNWDTQNTSSGKTVSCIQPDIFTRGENPYSPGEKISAVDIACTRSTSTFSAGSRFLVYGR